MTLNFQSILKVPDVEDSPNRTLELFDIGEMIADKYGVHKVDLSTITSRRLSRRI